MWRALLCGLLLNPKKSVAPEFNKHSDSEETETMRSTKTSMCPLKWSSSRVMSRQQRTNALAAFYQRSTWAIDNKI